MTDSNQKDRLRYLWIIDEGIPKANSNHMKMLRLTWHFPLLCWFQTDWLRVTFIWTPRKSYSFVFGWHSRLPGLYSSGIFFICKQVKYTRYSIVLAQGELSTNERSRFVTYWPSTQPSIKKEVHPVEDIEDITFTWGRVEIGAIATHTKQVDVKQLYKPMPQAVRVSWSQLVGVRVAVRGSENQLPPEDPRLSSPAEWERSAAIVRGTWGQYVAVCSVSNSPLTHNSFATLSQPFRIKCVRYIFLKKCVRSSLLLILFPHVYVYVSNIILTCCWDWTCNFQMIFTPTHALFTALHALPRQQVRITLNTYYNLTLVPVKRIGTVYLCGSNKDSFRDSVLAPQFNIKYWRKPKDISADTLWK